MKKRNIFIAVTIVLVTASFIFLYVSKNNIDTVPDISLNLIDGTKVNLSSLKGTPLLVTFWATTCATCVKEIPDLIHLYNELEQNEFEIIAIAMPYDPPNRVVTLAKKNNIPYSVALDIKGIAAEAFGNVQVTPTSFLIDTNGKVIEKKSGELDIKELKMKVKSLLPTKTKIS